ncbi:unnamed protein product [Aureobasidium uvarum]|uniref:Uncharacterized protein n=1 Tax=Aureobasidium uvarum TaxID=2773716 RepID=A0A9N8KNZ1_9PEZI|nr:unnamed protein product [Aureobasidium uvarum]
MPLSSSHWDTEHSLIALIDQTTQDPTRKHQRVQAIKQILAYQHQFQIQNMSPPHQPFLPSLITPTQVDMLHRDNPYAGSGQSRASSAHSTRATVGQHTTTYSNMSSVPTASCNAGAEQNRLPSYVSDPSTSELVSPIFPSNANISQTMPPPRPDLEHMIVSVNRQKRASDDMQWTTQFPLENLRNSTMSNDAFSISQLSYSRLVGEISDNLRSQVEEEGLSIVWVMSAIEQLGVVRDNGSLRAAVLDHQNTEKHTIQLYVVREKFINSKTFILPKVASPSTNILSPEVNQQDNTPRQTSAATFGRASSS